MKLKWSDIEEIAIRLYESRPDVDPLTVRFTDLREWIAQLPDFDDDPKHANEAKLEAVQMAWHSEYLDLHEED